MKMIDNRYLTEEEDINDPLRDYAEGVDCLDLDCSDSAEYDDVYGDDEDDWHEDWSDEEYDHTLDAEELDEGWVWVDDEGDDEEEPDPFTLVGVDGNIFAVIGYVARCMRKVKCDSYEIEAFRREVTHQDSYQAALRICCEQVDECNRLYHEMKKEDDFDEEF